MTTKRDVKPKPPHHLRPATAKWWAGVVTDYELEAHHIRLLTLAAESWDRCQEARQAIEENGLTFLDKHHQPRARPEVAIERDSRGAFCRVLRELGLDIGAPDDARPPAVVGKRRD